MKKIFEKALYCAVSLILIISTINHIGASEEFYSNDDINISVHRDYDSSSNLETISFLPEAKDSLKPVIISSIMIDNEEVKAIEEVYKYTYKNISSAEVSINYYIDGEDRSFDFKVDSKYLSEDTNNTSSVVTSGSESIYSDADGDWWLVQGNFVSYKIKDYNPSTGWEAGSVKEVRVSVDFTNHGLIPNKHIEFELASGLRYNKYPVINDIKNPNLEFTMSEAIRSQFTNNSQIIQNNINKTYTGILKYDVINNINDILEFSIYVEADQSMLNQNTTISNAIKLHTFVDTNLIEGVSSSINTKINVFHT